MKPLLALVLLQVSLWPLQSQDYMVVTGKSVIINGTTTLGKFTCDLEQQGRSDTVIFHQDHSHEIHPPVLDIALEVKAFGCGNKMLDKDFNHTLKSSEYPHIRVVVDHFFHEGDRYYSSLILKLAGKELYMERLPFLMKGEKGAKSMEADFHLNLSYFDLDPPKKFLGLLKVREELTILLNLQIL